ncbi:hypothetical protein AcV5_001912 [Taiwanofungus camphoratus]|nr:hypothetical protein AcV5_001912 [Antrodia cinnamomea]
MHNPWIMQMVQVISGPFKGYLGYIKSVNVSTIDIKMVTPVGRLYAFSFSQLAFWSYGGRLLPLDPSIQIRSEGVEAQFPGPSTPRPSTPRLFTPQPSTPQPSTPQSSVLKLEASAESSSVLAVNPMWDPSSRMPAETVEWLLLPTFAGALETYIVPMQLVNIKPHKEQGVAGFKDGRHEGTRMNTVPGLLPRDGKVAVEFKT